MIQQFVHRWHSKTEEVEVIQIPSRVSCTLTSYFSYRYHEKDKFYFPAAAETDLRKTCCFHNLKNVHLLLDCLKKKKKVYFSVHRKTKETRQNKNQVKLNGESFQAVKKYCTKNVFGYKVK